MLASKLWMFINYQLISNMLKPSFLNSELSSSSQSIRVAMYSMIDDDPLEFQLVCTLV